MHVCGAGECLVRDALAALRTRMRLPQLTCTLSLLACVCVCRHLYKNQITTLPAGVFQNMTSLQTL